jgi:hypothetical protein
MKTATPTPTDPVGIVNSLDADAIEARLIELDAEASALRVLFRSARARKTPRDVADAPARSPRRKRTGAMSSTFSVRDLSKRYCVSEHTILNWIRAGELQAVNVGRLPGAKKPRWRITQEALDQFEAQRTPTPAPLPPRRRKRPTEGIEFY